MGNRLSKIYTKTGDLGTTALADGHRMSKTDRRILTIGRVDHLNSLLGLARCQELNPSLDISINRLQHHLFDLGGELCMPELQSIEQSHIQWLETDIDRMNKNLPDLKEFILPGGSLGAAHLHMARTETRILETQMLEHHKDYPLRPEILSFMNRLSDWFFVAARFQLLHEGKTEVLWENPYKK